MNSKSPLYRRNLSFLFLISTSSSAISFALGAVAMTGSTPYPRESLNELPGVNRAKSLSVFNRSLVSLAHGLLELVQICMATFESLHRATIAEGALHRPQPVSLLLIRLLDSHH